MPPKHGSGSGSGSGSGGCDQGREWTKARSRWGEISCSSSGRYMSTGFKCVGVWAGLLIWSRACTLACRAAHHPRAACSTGGSAECTGWQAVQGGLKGTTGCTIVPCVRVVHAAAPSRQTPGPCARQLPPCSPLLGCRRALSQVRAGRGPRGIGRTQHASACRWWAAEAFVDCSSSSGVVPLRGCVATTFHSLVLSDTW